MARAISHTVPYPAAGRRLPGTRYSTRGRVPGYARSELSLKVGMRGRGRVPVSFFVCMYVRRSRDTAGTSISSPVFSRDAGRLAFTGFIIGLFILFYFSLCLRIDRDQREQREAAASSRLARFGPPGPWWPHPPESSVSRLLGHPGGKLL